MSDEMIKDVPSKVKKVRKHEWDKWRNDFIKDSLRRTITRFCIDNNISVTSGKRRAATERWLDQRTDYWLRLEDKIEEKVIEQVSTDIAAIRAGQILETREMITIAKKGIWERIKANGGTVPHEFTPSELRLLWTSALDLQRKVAGVPEVSETTSTVRNVDLTQLSDEQLEQLATGKTLDEVLNPKTVN